MCILFCVGNYEASAESREVCLLEQRVNSLSVVQNLRQNRSSARPISDEPCIHQAPCNEGYEPWWIFRGLLCQSALLEQVFVPFAEAAKKHVLSVASEPAGKKTVKTSTVRLSSENKTSGFLQCDPNSTVVNTTRLLIKLCSPLDFHKHEPRGLARQKRNPLTDARSDHSQTSGNTQTVFGDLTFARKFQGCQSPGSCRASQRSVTSGN